MTTAEKALLLAANVHVLANREDAGRFRADVLRMVESIERMVNRPTPPVECGPCPTPDPETQKPCGVGLTAKHGETETTCFKCKLTYNVKDLIDHALDTARGWKFSEREVLDIMAQIGRHIPRGTWWTWKQRGIIVNRNEWGAEPQYYLDDVQVAWEERVGKRNRAAG